MHMVRDAHTPFIAANTVKYVYRANGAFRNRTYQFLLGEMSFISKNLAQHYLGMICLG